MKKKFQKSLPWTFWPLVGITGVTWWAFSFFKKLLLHNEKKQKCLMPKMLAADMIFPEWTAYYDQFSYFSHDLIQEGCYPFFIESPENTKAIVVVHGLGDSPYYMKTVAAYFSEKGYNVYAPLLQGMGLKDSKNMEGVDKEEWKKNVEFALQVAGEKAQKVSIAGFSTGGALALNQMLVHPERLPEGAVYLFAGAVSIYPDNFIIEPVARLVFGTELTQVFDVVDNIRNPEVMVPSLYAYNYSDRDGVLQLSKLIDENNEWFDQWDSLPKKPPHHVYAMHSEVDKRVPFSSIKDLNNILKDQMTVFSIPAYVNVRHGAITLDKDLYDNGKVEKRANPWWPKIICFLNTTQEPTPCGT